MPLLKNSKPRKLYFILPIKRRKMMNIPNYQYSYEDGNTVIKFESNYEILDALLQLQESGELEKILGVTVLEIDASAVQQPIKITVESTALTSNWFQKIEVTDWLYDIGMQAAKLALKSYQNLTGNIGATAPTTLRGTPTPVTPIIDAIVFSGILGAAAFLRGNNPSQANRLEGLEALTSNTSQSSLSLTDLIDDVLNSNNKYSILMSAYELGKLLENVSNIPQGLINFLANRITTIEDSETRWQLALTLGKLNPDHPLGAVGQRKKIQLAGNRLELFLALRVGEDDLIDVLLQVYHARKDYLPVGLQVSLLDETEEVFLEVVAKEEERYLSLEFTGAIGQFFSVKFSLGDNYLIDNFVI
jgi:Protein of unknown function (DUF1822)